jgi:Flp pilus assembly protein TadG
MQRLSELWDARDGIGAVEFAFVAGILVMVLLGIADFGIGFWEQMQVGNAARSGAEYALRYGYDSSKIQTAATNATSLSGVTASASAQFCGCPDATTGVSTATCGSTCSDGDAAGTYTTVSAQVSYTTLFAWPWVSQPTTLYSAVTVRLQ